MLSPSIENIKDTKKLSESSHLVQTRAFALPSSLRPLAEKNFALLWVGAFLSNAGFWIQSIGQGWQVLQLTNSALLLGLVTFIATLPNLLLSPIGGVIADRFNRRHLLLFTQCFYMLISLLMGILTTLHIITVWQIILLALLNGVFSSVGFPAWQTFVGDLLPPSQLRQGIALNSTQFNLSRVIGPAIGGLSVGIFGIAGSYYLNALSYIAVIIPLLLMHTANREQRKSTHKSMWSDLRDGLQYVRKRPIAQIVLLLQFFIAFLVFPYQTLLPIFANNIYHIGATGLGLLNSAAGIGALLGSIILVMMTQRIQNGSRILVIVCCLGGGACLAFALSNSLPLSLALLICIGICSVLSSTLTNTILQMMVPQEMRSRVLSLWILTAFGLAPLGNLVAGWIAQDIGASLTLGIAGSICVILALCTFGFHSKTRTLPERETDHDGEYTLQEERKEGKLLV
ncbi:MFS transporter [Ktedonobacter sp. SOSP1-85]|uniref:MFS transporter n=1 Tax=Ktedonobacter sp. SOSP1-85 TaxID=2778367 RepID=UPI0019166DA3|nr:MFS transporter [Ktedonobacter sp. SOSP1-85]